MTEDMPHPKVAEAIAQGVKAGVFRRAQRLNPKSAKVWDEIAEPYSRSAAMALGELGKKVG